MLSSLKGNFPSAILALADGTVFVGSSIGAQGTTVGEFGIEQGDLGLGEVIAGQFEEDFISVIEQVVDLEQFNGVVHRDL